MTELEAVNQMLLTVGEDAVEDLGSGLYEAQLAVSFLRQVSREVQSKSWTFNTDKQYELVPDTQGIIEVPSSQILKVDFNYSNKDLTVRQNKLYNRDAHTYVFTEGEKVDVTWFLEFEDIPPVAQTYIYTKAARRFQKKVLGSDSLDNFTAADEVEALVDLEHYDARDGQYNMLNNTWGQQLYKGRY